MYSDHCKSKTSDMSGACRRSCTIRTSRSLVRFEHLAVYYIALTQLSGEEFTDAVTISPGVVITNQSIGVAQEIQGFDLNGVNGVLG
jgi:hypothetical protein